jgi:hypothetical protein
MKRSAQVALLLMGVSGVGAGAYALTPPRTNCVPQGAPPSAVAANPAGAPGAEPCPPRRQGSGIASGRSHFGSWSGSSSSSRTSSTIWSGPIFGRTSTSTPTPTAGRATSTVPAAGRATSTVAATGRSGTSSGGVTHGGFGSTGHAASAGS